MLCNVHSRMEEKMVKRREVLETVQNGLPAKETKVINAGEKNILDARQTAAKSKIGYAFSIITLGFLFCK